MDLIGYWFAVVCALLCLAALTATAAYLNVVASKYALKMLGGWSLLNEFAKWKREQERKREG